MAALDLLDELFGTPPAPGATTTTTTTTSSSRSDALPTQSPLQAASIAAAATAATRSVPRSEPDRQPSSASPATGDAALIASLIQTGRIQEAYLLSETQRLVSAADTHRQSLNLHRLVDDELETAIADRDAMRRCDALAALRSVVLSAFVVSHPNVQSSPYLDDARTTRLRAPLLLALQRQGDWGRLKWAATVNGTKSMAQAETPGEALCHASLTELCRGLMQLCTCAYRSIDVSSIVGSPSPVMNNARRLWATLEPSENAEPFLRGLALHLLVVRAVCSNSLTEEVQASVSPIVAEAHALFEALLSAFEADGSATAKKLRSELTTALKLTRTRSLSATGSPTKTLTCALTAVPLQASPLAENTPSVTRDLQAALCESAPALLACGLPHDDPTRVSMVVYRIWNRLVKRQ